jgi:hypothetical protein
MIHHQVQYHPMIVTIQSKYLNLSEVKHSFNNDFNLGLVDAEDEADFKIKLTSLNAKWDSKERCSLSNDRPPTFHDFITEKVCSIYHVHT